MTPIAPMPATPLDAPVRLVAQVGGVAVARDAGYVEGRLGWLHRARGVPDTDVAALIGAGLFWDGLHGHHPGRRLADALAARGIPTLRIDHPGCGDAIDLASGADDWAAWQSGLDAAAAWLLQRTGAGRLLLCGMRLGGTLAALAGRPAHADCARRCCWSPRCCAAGPTCASCASRHSWRSRRPRCGDGGFAFQEHVLNGPACARAMEAVDLSAETFAAGLPPGVAVAIGNARLPPASPIAAVAAWSARRGRPAPRCRIAGLAPLVAFDPGALPPPDFSAALAWAAAVLASGDAAAMP